MIGSIIYLAIVVIAIAGMWKTFEKAGQPGWGCIIPIYNIYLMTKISSQTGLVGDHVFHSVGKYCIRYHALQ